MKHTVSFKPSVRIRVFTPALEKILSSMRVVEAGPENLVVTSINDSDHGKISRHYVDEAVDIRSKNFPTGAEKKQFLLEMRKLLGAKFYIFLEDEATSNEHFHVQVRIGQVYP